MNRHLTIQVYDTNNVIPERKPYGISFFRSDTEFVTYERESIPARLRAILHNYDAWVDFSYKCLFIHYHFRTLEVQNG